jgi:hypothetical protein
MADICSVAKYQIDKGNSFNTQITISDPDGAAQDITGATVTMTIYDRNGDTLHTEAVTSHTTPASGITNIQISKSDTAGFPHGCYDYEVTCLLSDASLWTVQQGYFEVTP